MLVKLKKQLEREDKEQQSAGVTFLHGLSPATFLQNALEVEATQYVHSFSLMIITNPRIQGATSRSATATTRVEIRQTRLQDIAGLSSRVSRLSKSLSVSTCRAQGPSSIISTQFYLLTAPKMSNSGSPPLFPPLHVMSSVLWGSHASSTDFASPKPQTPSMAFVFFAG